MKVLVASGSALLRAVLGSALMGIDDIELEGPVSTLAELAEAVRKSAPQVVLASPALGDGDLYRALSDVLRAGARVLVVCDAGESAEASALLFAGASGCLLVQDADAADVVSAVRDTAAGHATLHPVVAASILSQWRSSRGPAEPVAPAPLIVELTAREADVLAALGRGLTTKSAARELGVSPKTVEAHIGRLLAKLGARTRAQAIAIALERGLLIAAEAEPAGCRG